MILICNPYISGTKRSFGDLEDDEDDIFGSKKVHFVIIRTLKFFGFYKS